MTRALRFRQTDRADVIHPAIIGRPGGIPVTFNLESIIKDNFGKLVNTRTVPRYIEDGSLRMGDVI